MNVHFHLKRDHVEIENSDFVMYMGELKNKSLQIVGVW